MGRDKGLLEYAGETAVRRAWRLLNAVCVDAMVSVRGDQSALVGYAELPLVIDGAADRGPASGLLAAWDTDESAAWLTLAVDMPLVDSALLLELVRGRAVSRVATTFRHADGILEPLCTIWEPQARELLAGRVESGRFSLREALETNLVQVLEPAESSRLLSVNSPEQYAAIRDERT
jgi:molybdopterin-guanine dinucleotide biosynthesis protein A